MKTFPVALVAAVLLCAPLSAAQAGTEFDYTGNNFSYCFDANTGLNSGCTGSSITGHFVTSLSGSALDNLTDVFIENTFLSIDGVTEFSFSDGLGLDLTDANADSVYFRISTDATGNLTNWSIIVQQAYGAPSYLNDLEILSAPSAGSGTDLSHHCVVPSDYCVEDYEYFESYPQGIWTRQDADVPEPATFSLLGAGLAALGFVSGIAKRKRRTTAI